MFQKSFLVTLSLCLFVTNISFSYSSDASIPCMTIESWSETCDDNGTLSDPTDDYYVFFANANPLEGGPSNQFWVMENGIPINGPFFYGSGGYFSLPADGTSKLITYVDYDEPNCFAEQQTSVLDPCSATCTLTITQLTDNCNDNGTPADPTDDYYEILTNAEAINGGTQGLYEVYAGGTLAGIFTYGTGGMIVLAADGSSPTLTFSDVDFPNCNASQPIGPLVPCSNLCVLTVNEFTRICNDNSTPNISTDDFYLITINASGVNTGVSNHYEVLEGGVSLGVFPYDIDTTFTIPTMGDTTLYFLISDAYDPGCNQIITVDDWTHCSTCYIDTSTVNIALDDPNTAVLDWQAVPDAISYQTRHRVIGTSTWTVTGSVVPTSTLEGLIPNTVYDYRIRARCPDGSWSEMSPIRKFRTSVCSPPTNASYVVNTPYRVTVSWDAMPYADKYQVRYRPLGTSAWSNYTTTNTSRSIPNLIPGTTYQCRVRAWCENSWSILSPSIYFNTNNARLHSNQFIQDINVFPNPCKDILTVEINSEETEKGSLIEIFDMLGKKLLFENISSNRYQINTDFLEEGMYFLKINNNTPIKFIKK